MLNDIIFEPLETAVQCWDLGNASGKPQSKFQIGNNAIRDVLDRLAFINDERAIDAVIKSMNWLDETQKKELKKLVMYEEHIWKLRKGRCFQYRATYPGNPKKSLERFGSVENILAGKKAPKKR